MSTLRVSSIQDTSGGNSSTPSGIANGIAKAWINFNGGGAAAPSTNSSYNVSAITDIAVGRYELHFTNAMPDINYVMTGACSSTSGNTNAASVSVDTGVGPVFTVPTTSILAIRVNLGTSYQDATWTHVAIFR